MWCSQSCHHILCPYPHYFLEELIITISNVKVPSHVQQVGDIRSCIRQEVHSSVKVIGVDIHEKLALASVKEGKELDVSVVNYVSPESKAEPRQSRMDKAYHSGCLLRALWKSDHLCLIWVNGSTYNFITHHLLFL